MSTYPPLPAPVPRGHDLHRPECVVATRAGDVFVPDWRGGVTVIRANGLQQTWLASNPPIVLRPNALALTPHRTFLLANLGDDGGVWELQDDGTLRPFLVEVEGQALPPANFVTLEPDERVWISVSTRHQPRQLAWRNGIADGFIILVDEQGARIVADGLHYTNEVRPDPTGRWLYVVETFGRRILRFPIGVHGQLGARDIVVEFGRGIFPDGFAFDETGALWVTSLVSNRLLRVDHDGRVDTLIEDVNQDFVDRAEEAFATATMASVHLGPIPGTRFQQLTSIAFGGADRRTAYLGSLHAGCIYEFAAPVAGAEPAHWRRDAR